MTGEPVVRIEGLTCRYPGASREALTDVTLGFPAGSHAAVLGPNGAGKSTLLRAILGLVSPSRGQVRLWERPASAWRRRELARRAAAVGQDRPPDFPLTVTAFVEMGRNPYLRPWEAPGPRDRTAVARALERTDMSSLAGRRISELSQGELQRAKLARALAQEPRLLLLDEPTAHLDLGHEVEIFHLVRALVQDEGLTAVSVTHSLHLASRYADVLVLLSGGRVAATGTAEAVLRAATVERAFGWPVRVVDLEPFGLHVVPLPPGDATDGRSGKGGGESRPARPGGGAERDRSRERWEMEGGSGR